MEQPDRNKFDFYLKGTSDKAVLLIHGITGTPSEMNYLGKALNAAGFSVLCKALPGHCSTLSDLKKVTWQEIAGACEEQLAELKKEHPKVFAGGLSMGALMACHLAYKHPEQLTGIIALAPTFFYDGWAVDKKKYLMEILWHVPSFRNMYDIRESWPYGLKDERARGFIERFYKKAEASKFDKNVLLFGSPFFPMACLYQHHLFTKAVKKELATVKTPVLIIHAREDDMTSPKNSEYLYRNIGSADKTLVMLDDSYHMITIDKEKDKVAAEIVGFLNKH